MNYEFHNEPCPHVIINNFFNEEELKLVWKELDFLTSGNKLLDEKSTGAAVDKQTGVILKKNYGLFMDEIYPKRNLSNILTLTNKVFDKSFMESISKKHWVFRYMNESTRDSTLLSYYEDGGYYNYHFDFASITMVIHLFKEPQKFRGGELVLEGDHSLSIINNRAILFPSIINHKVNEIKMDDNGFSGNGRYCISKFIHII